MQSQIIFLGTAGDSFVLSKLERTGGGFIIQTKESQVHVNPGPGALFCYRFANPNILPQKTTAIIVTDNTLLHCHDANAIIDVMTLGGFDSKGILLATKSALHFDEKKNNIPIISPHYQTAVEKTIILQDETSVACNDVQLYAVKTKNNDQDAVGLKIVTDEFSLGYTGKTKYAQKIKDGLQDVEILILELSLLYNSKKEEGLCVEEAQKLISDIKPQLAVLTGFGITVLKEDILELSRNMSKKAGVQIIAAKDGFSFDPTSYSVKLRQKRLHY